MLSKAFGIVGYSGSGKTTLIERLLPWFMARSLKVAVIKQSHHDFEAGRARQGQLAPPPGRGL